MSINWQFSRTVTLASVNSAWENRNSLIAPGLAIGVIDYISLMERMSSIAPALQFVSFALVVTLAVLIHRSMLLEDHRLNLQWGMREVRYLLVFLALIASGFLIFAFLQYFSLYALTGVLLPAEYPLPKDLRLSEYEAPEAIQTRLFYIVIASSVIGLAGFAALFSRFYLLLPAAATDQFLSLAEVWENTRANQLPMFFILLIPILLLLPVSYGFQYQAMIPFVLVVQFLIVVFIFSSMTIGFYLIQNNAEE